MLKYATFLSILTDLDLNELNTLQVEATLKPSLFVRDFDWVIVVGRLGGGGRGVGGAVRVDVPKQMKVSDLNKVIKTFPQHMFSQYRSQTNHVYLVTRSISCLLGEKSK